MAAGSAITGGIAAKRGELAKFQKYKELPGLCPFAIEAGGKIGNLARAAVRDLCPHPRGHAARSSWITEAYQDLAVTLQKENARTFRHLCR